MRTCVRTSPETTSSSCCSSSSPTARVHARNVGPGGVGPSGDPHSGGKSRRSTKCRGFPPLWGSPLGPIPLDPTFCACACGVTRECGLGWWCDVTRMCRCAPTPPLCSPSTGPATGARCCRSWRRRSTRRLRARPRPLPHAYHAAHDHRHCAPPSRPLIHTPAILAIHTRTRAAMPVAAAARGGGPLDVDLLLCLVTLGWVVVSSLLPYIMFMFTSEPCA